MADSNFLRSSIFSKQPRLRVISHSRTISIIPKHQNNKISFMPKFLIKTLHRKKQHHRRCSTTTFLGVISPDTGYSVPGLCEVHEQIGKTKMTGKKTRKNNPVMRLIQDPKSVVSKISTFLSSSKKSSLERTKCLSASFSSLFRSKKHGLIKSVKRKTGSENSYEESKPETGKTEKNSMKRGGLKIKGFSRIKNKGKGEKRFELCKKKILMGEKCRPLDGHLRYDKTGVLIPEDLP